MKVDEDNTDEEILKALESDDDLLEYKIREKRIFEIKQELCQKKVEGKLYTFINEKELMNTITTIKNCVVHFGHKDFKKCRIMDTHLQKIAEKHVQTRFCKINVEDCSFLVDKLALKVLPCVISFIDGVGVDRLVGFDGLVLNGNDFPTVNLEKRLAQSSLFIIKLGVIQMHSIKKQARVLFSDSD
jgi:hypothetical protein